MSDQDGMRAPEGARDAGEAGEAVTAALISDILGGDLIYQHTFGEAPQGIDLAYLNDGQLHVSEVKSVIGDWHLPSTSTTVDGRQMDTEWVADRLDRVDISATGEQVGSEQDHIRTDLYQVDFPGETIARYDMNLDGTRTDSFPQEVWSLTDVLGVYEEANSPEGHMTTEAGEKDTDESGIEGEG